MKYNIKIVINSYKNYVCMSIVVCFVKYIILFSIINNLFFYKKNCDNM